MKTARAGKRAAVSAPAPRRARQDAARVTPLARRLETPSRATPQDLFTLALDWWKKGERFDIGRMAQELGVSRATVFRWVGSRELLYGEVLSKLFEGALAHARKTARGEGPDLIADVTQRLFRLLVTDEPLRTFVRQDAEYAMRILMSRSSTVEQRCAASIRASLEEGVRLGVIRPVMDLDALAYVILRIGESFLYRDALTGDPVDVESAITAIRILLTVERDDVRWKRR
ncbi:transcriptional regulator [Pyxidicoccus fallax]|uniref:TetR/AcrR family transcriptional regulator n=1 Tax=Pyxidicoccus fallax TaxID=394095 RepID=A0A848LXE9_9BACT|nr:QsdR family transcriptional regulator [Pyxidicoccus fallax]NMO22735.1 TetR/AcrR family transcriptional regulator [Pyxidicoccus fallax]NPC84907.1 transcriptional regulator [Pyxidicoccus fallax]